jgi:sodium transport system ATP-binding protein
MHRGHFLDSGTLSELLERHRQQDLEELFFELITRHDEQRHLDQTRAGSTA